MSTREGAFEAVVPVAAHIPGGGFASISFRLAVRTLLEIIEALVDVLLRRVLLGESGGVTLEFGSRMPLGCGNGTGVGISFEEVIFASERLRRGDSTSSVTVAQFPLARLAKLYDRWYDWQWHNALAGTLL
jgi:hypothetical protein